eukprot:COSAG01_NODE_16977_length_1188_cov_6.323232_2_plen_141_part_00
MSRVVLSSSREMKDLGFQPGPLSSYTVSWQSSKRCMPSLALRPRVHIVVYNGDNKKGLNMTMSVPMHACMHAWPPGWLARQPDRISPCKFSQICWTLHGSEPGIGLRRTCSVLGPVWVHACMTGRPGTVECQIIHLVGLG